MCERPTRKKKRQAFRRKKPGRRTTDAFFRPCLRVKNEPGSRQSFTGAGLTQERIIAIVLLDKKPQYIFRYYQTVLIEIVVTIELLESNILIAFYFHYD